MSHGSTSIILSKHALFLVFHGNQRIEDMISLAITLSEPCILPNQDWNSHILCGCAGELKAHYTIPHSNFKKLTREKRWSMLSSKAHHMECSSPLQPLFYRLSLVRVHPHNIHHKGLLL
jgi:hypothetical protein